MARRNWTREETILALYLYCKTPFGKIHRGNREIIEFAEMIGRTPSSFGLKMCNLAAVDPTLKQSGMSHGSKLDAEIFNEFYNNWEDLAVQAYTILKNLRPSNSISNKIEKDIPAGADKVSVVKQRVGQEFYRTSVLASYDMRCCITGLSDSKLLIASHIKPWSRATNTEKTNPSNGLCLNPFHDSLFDKGYISLDDDYKIMVSPKLRKIETDPQTRDWLFQYEGKSIHLPRIKAFAPCKVFLEYHRDSIFLK